MFYKHIFLAVTASPLSTLLSLLLVSSSTGFSGVTACTTSCYLNTTVQNTANFSGAAQGAGPSSLYFSFPLYTYGGPGAPLNLSTIEIDNAGPLLQQPGQNVMTTSNTYLIFYGNNFTTGTGGEIAYIQNFVSGIGNNSIWKNVVKQYAYNGTVIPATPTLNGSIQINPSLKYNGSCQPGYYGLPSGFNITASETDSFQQEELLLSLFQCNVIPYDANGLYLLVLGRDVTYHYVDVEPTLTPPVNIDLFMGDASGFCATHDRSVGVNPFPYGDVNYVVVGMPSAGSVCNLFPYNGPTGSASLDNTINFLFHVS